MDLGSFIIIILKFSFILLRNLEWYAHPPISCSYTWPSLDPVNGCFYKFLVFTMAILLLLFVYSEIALFPSSDYKVPLQPF